jgi:chemotaxis protein MotB
VQAAVQEREAARQRLEEQEARHKAQVTQLEAQVVQQQQAVAQAQAALAAARRDLEAVRTESQQWQQRYSEATRTLQETRETLQRVTAEAAAARQQLETQKTQRLQEMARLQALYERVAQELEEAIQRHQVTLQKGSNRLTIRIGGEALFRPGRVSLRTESRNILDRIVTALQAFPGYQIQVEGHTDNVPIGGRARDRWPTNWELSAARATVVVRYMQQQGIAPEQLTASGFAFYRPVSSNDTPEGRARNRRIEITVFPPATMGKND